MKAFLKLLFGVKVDCAGCRTSRHLWLPELLCCRPPCPHCGLRPHQFVSRADRDQTVITLPGCPQNALFVFFPAGFFSFMMLLNGNLVAPLIALAIAFTVFRLALSRCGHPKQLILAATTIRLEDKLYPCGPDTDTRVEMLVSGKQAGVMLRSGFQFENLSAGLDRAQWPQLLRLLDTFIRQQAVPASEPPAEVLAVEARLDEHHAAELQEQPALRSAGTSIMAGCRLAVERQGGEFRLRTSPDFRSHRFLPALMTGAIPLLVLTSFVLGSGLLTGAARAAVWLVVPALPILFLMHPWIIGIGTSFRDAEIEISYYLLGILVWWRRFPARDLLAVVPAPVDGVALATTSANFRIAHGCDRQLQRRLIVLVERHLQGHGRELAPRFRVEQRQHLPIAIDLAPGTSDSFRERFRLPRWQAVIAATVVGSVISLAGGAMAGLGPWFESSMIPVPGIIGGVFIAALVISGRYRRLRTRIIIGAEAIAVERRRGDRVCLRTELDPRRVTVNAGVLPPFSTPVLKLVQGSRELLIGARLSPAEQDLLKQAIQELMKRAEGARA